MGRYFGNNLRFRARYIKTASACRQACASRSNCHYMSFVDSTKTCYLKNKSGNKRLKRSTNLNDITWSKQCEHREDTLSLDEFKILVLQEANNLMNGAKQTSVAQQ